MKNLIYLFVLILFGCSDSRFDIKGEIIGKWKEEHKVKNSFVLYVKEGKNYIRHIYSDNDQFEDYSVSINEVSYDANLKGKKIQYSDPGMFYGEHFLLREDGKLMMINNENKVFAVADPI